MDLTDIKRHWGFSDLKVGMIAWLGHSPDERRIEVEIVLNDDPIDQGLEFWVINGAWGGMLFEGEEGCLSIVDERGTRHEPVYLVEARTPDRDVNRDEIAF